MGIFQTSSHLQVKEKKVYRELLEAKSEIIGIIDFSNPRHNHHSSSFPMWPRFAFVALVRLFVGWHVEPLGATVLLRTELYADFCDDVGASYETNLEDCYNGASLFNDEDWGDFDIFDAVASDDEDIFVLHRTFYDSNSSVCEHPVDYYILPIDECVGPFGKPHPWGRFSLINITHNVSMNEIATYN